MFYFILICYYTLLTCYILDIYYVDSSGKGNFGVVNSENALLFAVLYCTAGNYGEPMHVATR